MSLNSRTAMYLSLRTITTAFQQSKVSVTKNPDDIKNVLFDFFLSFRWRMTVATATLGLTGCKLNSLGRPGSLTCPCTKGSGLAAGFDSHLGPFSASHPHPRSPYLHVTLQLCLSKKPWRERGSCYSGREICCITSLFYRNTLFHIDSHYANTLNI